MYISNSYAHINKFQVKMELNRHHWLILTFAYLCIVFLLIYGTNLSQCSSQRKNNCERVPVPRNEIAPQQKVCKNYKTLFGMSDDSRKLGAVSLQIPIPCLPLPCVANNTNVPPLLPVPPTPAREDEPKFNIQLLRYAPEKSSILALQSLNNTDNSLLFSLNDEGPFKPETISELEDIANKRKLKLLNYSIGPANTSNVIMSFNDEILHQEFGDSDKKLVKIRDLKSGHVLNIKIVDHNDFETDVPGIDVKIRSPIEGAISDNVKTSNKNIIVTIGK